MPARSIDDWSKVDFDACVVSFPKCGRTWVRLMLGKLITSQQGTSFQNANIDHLFNVYEATVARSELPTVVFTHDDWPQHNRPADLTADKTKLYNGKTVVLLIRDLRDVMVSNFFQLTKREQLEGYRSMSEYIKGEIGGATSFVTFYNHWWANRHVAKHVFVMRYEDLHRDPEHEMRRLLDALEWPTVSIETLRAVIAWSNFDNLRQQTMQATKRELQPRNQNDPESFKMRRGKMGGYVDYLSKEDIAFLNDQMNQLNIGYGYRGNP